MALEVVRPLPAWCKEYEGFADIGFRGGLHELFLRDTRGHVRRPPPSSDSRAPAD
jgi:hypothetical protein